MSDTKDEGFRRIAPAVAADELCERRLFLRNPTTGKLLRIVEHEWHVIASTHSKGLVRVDIDQIVGVTERVGQAAEPAVGLAAVGRAGVPIGHRREMRE